MWRLRQATQPLRRGDIVRGILRNRLSVPTSPSFLCSSVFSPKSLLCSQPVRGNVSVGSRNYCKQVDRRNSDEEGCPELEDSSGEEDVDGLDDTVLKFPEAETSDTKMGQISEVSSSKARRASLELFNAIKDAPSRSVFGVVDSWAKMNRLDRTSVTRIKVALRKRKMYGKALQFSEWLRSSKHVDLNDRDYASQLDLICKVRGIKEAENFMKKIPESFRSESVYRTLLACYVHLRDLKKAESLFKEMTDLKFLTTVDSCNQMIILYKRLDKKKVPDVISLMEKEKIKPSLLTYKLLIDIKGESNDIIGMEQIIESIKTENIEPDIQTLSLLAKHYISGGLKDKAETVLKEIEKGNMHEVSEARRVLLLVNASLGKANEVEKIWEGCKSDPRLSECVAAIVAWGRLGKVDEAEAVFEMMRQKWKKLSSRHYSYLLNVYVDQKLATKANELIKQMGDAGCWIGPITWDALVRLYAETGDLLKADTILHKAAQQNQARPLFQTFMVVMKQYAERGDMHNAERLFHLLKENGYSGRMKPFELLIQAYISAKTPAYGLLDRMRADNLFPNRKIAEQLSRVDAFKKMPLSLQ